MKKQKENLSRRNFENGKIATTDNKDENDQAQRNDVTIFPRIVFEAMEPKASGVYTFIRANSSGHLHLPAPFGENFTFELEEGTEMIYLPDASIFPGDEWNHIQAKLFRIRKVNSNLYFTALGDTHNPHPDVENPSYTSFESRDNNLGSYRQLFALINCNGIPRLFLAKRYTHNVVYLRSTTDQGVDTYNIVHSEFSYNANNWGLYDLPQMYFMPLS
jgi:hypothetical protein